jgi:hypothetical protein
MAARTEESTWWTKVRVWTRGTAGVASNRWGGISGKHSNGGKNQRSRHTSSKFGSGKLSLFGFKNTEGAGSRKEVDDGESELAEQ